VSQDEIESTQAPLIEHLAELRTRLIRAVIGFVLAFLVSFYFAADIFNLLLWPYRWSAGVDVDLRLIYTAPQEFFFTQLKIGMFGGLFLAFPMIAIQIYKFMAPGLYKNEREAFRPYLMATPILFLVGACLVFFFIMPVALTFFASFQQAGGDGQAKIELLPRVSEYLSLVMTLILAFGICFQLPVILTLLGPHRRGQLRPAQGQAQIRHRRRRGGGGDLHPARPVLPARPRHPHDRPLRARHLRREDRREAARRRPGGRRESLTIDVRPGACGSDPRQPMIHPPSRRLNRDAFGGPCEADLIERLHGEGLAAVSLVAVEDGTIVGHILFSDLAVELDGRSVRPSPSHPCACAATASDGGREAPWCAPASMRCARPDTRRSSCSATPEYYPRFGFSSELAEKLVSPFPGNAFMALELVPGALRGTHGKVTYPAAFGVDSA
jgi:sec-independent protein translocase protein TatC